MLSWGSTFGRKITFRAWMAPPSPRHRNGATISARSQLASADRWDSHVVGESAAIREVIALATQVATSRSVTVLLVGETGTGKELFARGIHAASQRAAEPF